MAAEQPQPQQQPQPQPQPQPQQQYPPPAYPPPAVPAPPPKKRGCLKGCLAAALALLLVGLVACGWFFRWPAKLGIVESPAEQMFEENGPLPVVDAVLMADLEERGFDSTGALLYVAESLEHEDGSVALFFLDESEGFSWMGEESSPVESLMLLVATSQVAQDAGIVRVAVDYRDSEGERVTVLTGPTDVIRAYAEGSATREEFLTSLDGQASLGKLIDAQLGVFQ
jgi:hypothetical protein